MPSGGNGVDLAAGERALVRTGLAIAPHVRFAHS
jgi:hypothetical protein